MPKLRRCLMTLVTFVTLVLLMLLGSVSRDRPWPQRVQVQRSDLRTLLVDPEQHGDAFVPESPSHKTTPTSQGKGPGYILALHYSDQLTAGSVNLLSLQCWAAHLGEWVKVVEPFLRDGSYWGIEEVQLHNDYYNVPKLRDIFSATRWRLYAKKRQFSPLANWGEFLRNAPRKIILVGMACETLENKFRDFAMKLEGFQVVREVCTSSETVFSAAQFRSHVYALHRPGDVVVLFDRWSGISETLSQPPLRYRIPITGMQRCERSSRIKKFMDSIPQSRRILDNARSYITRYLSKSFSNDSLVPRPSNKENKLPVANSTSSGYIAIMFRLEQLFVRQRLVTEADQLEGGRRCVKSILRLVSALKESGPVRRVFLAMDTGKYGSYKFRQRNNTSVHQLSHDLFKGLYPSDSMSYTNWEDSFSHIADFSAPGYIAMLQLGVAVHASELLLAGGGSFQSIAERETKYQHKSNVKVYHVKNC